MPQTYKTQYAIEVSYLCDKCNEGYMRWGGMTLTSNPPWYPHSCGNCGQTENMRRTYPFIGYSDKPGKAPKE